MIYYVCKYTPIELFRGFGEECSVLEEMPVRLPFQTKKKAERAHTGSFCLAFCFLNEKASFFTGGFSFRF